MRKSYRIHKNDHYQLKRMAKEQGISIGEVMLSMCRVYDKIQPFYEHYFGTLGARVDMPPEMFQGEPNGTICVKSYDDWLAPWTEQLLFHERDLLERKITWAVMYCRIMITCRHYLKYQDKVDTWLSQNVLEGDL